MPADHRWFDGSQPQTLQGAVMLCYLTAVFGVIGLVVGIFPVEGLVMLSLSAAGYGVANEKRWGYRLGVGLAVLNVLFDLALFVTGAIGIIFTLLFAIVLLVLFLHSHSREYERIWFH